MYMIWIQLLVTLVIILISAQVFSNALEHLGQKLKISTGVTGSIFAAVATALPETMVPILAILAGTSDKTVNEEIGVGAILGAPLMLSTLSTFLMALSVLRKRTWHGKILPEKSGLIRDLNFFLVAFGVAMLALYVPSVWPNVRIALSIFLIGLYFVYLLLTFRASKGLVQSGHGVEPSDKLLLTRVGLRQNVKTIVIQLILGLALLIVGAKGFIGAIHGISDALKVSALLLSLLIVPIATELPEKVNSIIWIRKNKDTLAFGNITGAMVFQGSLLPALGILLTPWQPDRMLVMGFIISLFAASWLRWHVSRKELTVSTLFLNGLLYLIYFILVI